MKVRSLIKLFVVVIGLLPPCMLYAVERTCQTCHYDSIDFAGYYRSVHGNNTCTSCHSHVGRWSQHIAGQDRAKEVNCALCHQIAAAKYRRDVHNLKLNMACQDCHQPIHKLDKSRGEPAQIVTQTCSRCHPREDYALLGHGRYVDAGNPDAPSCADCHGLHNIPLFDLSPERAQAWARETYTRKCQSCHGNVKMARRNKFSTKTVKGYYETYHGKVMAAGYPQHVAGCADCHTGHNTLPKEDTRSAIHPHNLYRSCQNCHSPIHQRFVAFDPHPNPRDPKRNPILYWTNVFMIALLTGTFLFFWTHTVLWWQRAYAEKYRRSTAGIHVPSSGGIQLIKRFSFRDRFMHVLLIISFFTLVLTGFPIKYYDAPWAKILLNFWGGPAKAGMFHRAAAILLWGLFLYTCWLCVKFLFPHGQKKGWLKRLFGPDSLCPNLKDLQDIAGMFRWFFHRGEMPRFDRWTYWEKFDFFAVFWGMMAIGLSGLTLWFPELASYLLPGWVINMAAVVHSEEAFLAAIFIFTVHFFNNHLVPNKFPLERNIFTGSYPLTAMKSERPLEYERMLTEGKLEAMTTAPPGIGTQLFASLFGLGSLLLGLVLTALIVWAAIF